MMVNIFSTIFPIFLNSHFNQRRNKISKFIQQAIELEVFNIYWKCEKRCLTYMKRIGLFVPFNQAMQTITLIYAIFTVCIGTFDALKLPFSFYMVVPFDYGTMWGWFLMWAIQFSMTFTYGTAMVSITCYFVGCCSYLSAIRDHFEYLILATKIAVEKRKGGRIEKRTKQSELLITVKISEAIKIHMKLLE